MQSRFLLTVAGVLLATGSLNGVASAKVGRARDAFQRKVVLRDFTASPAAAELAQDQPNTVAQAMDQFSTAPDQGPAEGGGPATIAYSPVPYSPTVGLQVPAWMMPNRAVQPAMVAVSAGGCASAYRPSGTLTRIAEERRRIIYPLVVEAACSAGLPVGLMDALIMQESRYNPLAISPKGAIGLSQLMSDTARSLGANPYDVRGNLLGGARYLRQQMDEFRAPHLALAAYNAGPGRVRHARGVPAIAETRNYVDRVLSNWLTVTGSPVRTTVQALPAVAVAASRPRAENPFRRAALLAF